MKQKKKCQAAIYTSYRVGCTRKDSDKIVTDAFLNGGGDIHFPSWFNTAHEEKR